MNQAHHSPINHEMIRKGSPGSAGIHRVSAEMKIQNPFRHLIRRVGILPPEPCPEPTDIDRYFLPPVVSEHQSSDKRLVILVTQNSGGLFRAHQFTWVTHADDDCWSACWSDHPLGIITDQHPVVMAEVSRRLQDYEGILSSLHSEREAEQQAVTPNET